MSEDNRIYFARRAQEEQTLALDAAEGRSAHIHRAMQRAYLEKALVGDRPIQQMADPIG